MGCLEDRSFLALDGTGSCSSKTMHCAACLPKVPRNGTVTYAHQLFGAASIHPDLRTVMPLMPEPLVKQDGTRKNAGARHAAKRFMAQVRHEHPPARASSLQTVCVPRPRTARRDKTPICPLCSASKQVTMPGCSRRGRQRNTLGTSPLLSGMTVRRMWGIGFAWSMRSPAMPPTQTCGSISLSTGRSALTRCNISVGSRTSACTRGTSFTSCGVDARGGRLTIETCNTLKNQGDHFAHTYGHGEQHLSVVFALVLLLAFLVDQTPQRCCALCPAVGAKLGSKRLLWERLRALFHD